jgi:hypothetical protein
MVVPFHSEIHLEEREVAVDECEDILAAISGQYGVTTAGCIVVIAGSPLSLCTPYCFTPEELATIIYGCWDSVLQLYLCCLWLLKLLIVVNKRENTLCLEVTHPVLTVDPRRDRQGSRGLRPKFQLSSHPGGSAARWDDERPLQIRTASII